MAIVAAEREACAICGRDERAAGHWFCHFYPPDGPVALCSPVCAEVYLARLDTRRAPGAAGRPEEGGARATRDSGVAPAGTAFPM